MQVSYNEWSLGMLLHLISSVYKQKCSEAPKSLYCSLFFHPYALLIFFFAPLYIFFVSTRTFQCYRSTLNVKFWVWVRFFLSVKILMLEYQLFEVKVKNWNRVPYATYYLETKMLFLFMGLLTIPSLFTNYSEQWVVLIL